MLKMAQEQQSTASILDFLYVDIDRIKSWLAQLHDDGVLLTHKRTESSGSTSTQEAGGSLEAAGNAGVLIAKAGLKALAQGKTGAGESFSATHESNFDASWTVPLNFLDLASEYNLINEDLASAAVGSLVKFSGQPEVRDIKFLQDIWKPAISHFLGQKKSAHSNKAAIAAQREQMQQVGEILGIMPPHPQMVICGEDDTVSWSSLTEDYMRVSSTSLALTHGFSIEGEWSIVGILDASPDAEFQVMRPAALAGHELIDAMLTVVGEIRKLVGRPVGAYGITPLLIYRKVEVTD